MAVGSWSAMGYWALVTYFCLKCHEHKTIEDIVLRWHKYWESMSSYISSSETTLATKCNSGSNKWQLSICWNSVPQQGVESWPLTIWVSIITTSPSRHKLLAHSPLQGEIMSSCVLSSEITFATKWQSVIWPQQGLNHFKPIARTLITPVSVSTVVNY